ncbi:MAG: CDC27 family protein, partial [Sulfurospirillaceae bacterium]|nr:CDC27 family protein [Sulfurospirillaceae bacterium]
PHEAKKPLNMSVKSLGSEEALLKNFHSANTFNTAYELAEFYFNAKEYPKAIVWAKESSKLGPTSEKPWIIYAKSKFYLGEKTEAIRALEIYLGYSSSKEVKDLLNFYKGQL